MNLLALSLFQHALLVTFVLLFLGSVWAMVKGWAGRREGPIWAAVWLAAGVAVLWPQVTSRVAKTLGIGRGADLVFYCAVVIMLIGFWSIYIRLRRVRRDITLLVRHLALQEGEKEATRKNDTPGMANTSGQSAHSQTDTAKPE